VLHDVPPFQLGLRHHDSPKMVHERPRRSTPRPLSGGQGCPSTRASAITPEDVHMRGIREGSS
jgi:hypothetical protein